MKEMKMNLRQFRKLVKNQSLETLHVWMVFSKMHRDKLSKQRQSHFEKVIPGWTWELTKGDLQVFDRITPEGQQALKDGKLPFYQDLSGEYHVAWKDADNNPLSVTLGGYARMTGTPKIVKVG
jgi:hypothetical protein